MKILALLIVCCGFPGCERRVMTYEDRALNFISEWIEKGELEQAMMVSQGHPPMARDYTFVSSKKVDQYGIVVVKISGREHTFHLLENHDGTLRLVSHLF